MASLRICDLTFLLLAVLCTVPRLAAAQVLTDERLWASISVQERSGTASDWRWAADGFVRTREGVGTVDSIGARLLIGIDVSRRSSLWAGYSAGPSFPAAGGTILEQRLTQQYLWNGQVAGGALALRSRLEQRFIEGNSAPQWRVRQQLRFSRPLSSASRFAVVISDEVFFHLNETSRFDRDLDQNRVFAGLSRSIDGGVRIEAGYLNQYSHSRVGPNRMNHVLSAGAGVTF